jgi:hypothetical protein
MAGKVQRYLAALALGLAAVLLIERGPVGLWAIENDRVSLLHVVPFGALALAWPLVTVLPQWLRSRRGTRPEIGFESEPRGSWARGADARRAIARRAGAAALGMVAVAALMLLLFPELRAGPLGQVDPLYARVRLQRITEIQPLLPRSLLAEGELGEAIRRVVRTVGIALPAIPFLVLLLARERGAARRIWAYVALVLGIFLSLTFYQVRWGSYAQLVLLLPYGALVGWLLRGVARHVGARAAPYWRAPLILVGLFWPLLPILLLPHAGITIASCPIARITPAIERAAAGERRTIMAYADYGPEILYRTRHAVLSIPNHRPQPGFAATYHVLTATDEGAARAELARFGVDWILLCPNPVERGLFMADAPSAPTLYRRLVDGAPPSWLRPLPLDDQLAADVRLYEVVRPTAAALAPAAHP